MTTIQLQIPEDLASRIAELTPNAELFIIDSIQLRLGKLNQLTLADEYSFASNENENLVKDFSSADMENWGDAY